MKIKLLWKCFTRKLIVYVQRYWLSYNIEDTNWFHLNAKQSFIMWQNQHLKHIKRKENSFLTWFNRYFLMEKIDTLTCIYRQLDLSLIHYNSLGLFERTQLTIYCNRNGFLWITDEVVTFTFVYTSMSPI